MKQLLFLKNSNGDFAQVCKEDGVYFTVSNAERVMSHVRLDVLLNELGKTGWRAVGVILDGGKEYVDPFKMNGEER